MLLILEIENNSKVYKNIYGSRFKCCLMKLKSIELYINEEK